MVIETSDFSLLGQVADLEVKISADGALADAQILFLTVFFEADKPSFDLEGFEVEPLTCNYKNANWYVRLPDVKFSGPQ